MAINALLLSWPGPMAVGMRPIPCILRDSTFSHSAYLGQTQSPLGYEAVSSRSWRGTCQHFNIWSMMSVFAVWSRMIGPWHALPSLAGARRTALLQACLHHLRVIFLVSPPILTLDQPSSRLLLASPPSSLVHGLEGLGSGLVYPNFLFPSLPVSGVEYLKMRQGFFFRWLRCCVTIAVFSDAYC